MCTLRGGGGGEPARLVALKITFLNEVLVVLSVTFNNFTLTFKMKFIFHIYCISLMNSLNRFPTSFN